MPLLDVLLRVTTVTATLLALSLPPTVGLGRLRSIYRYGIRKRIADVLPYFVFLGIVLGVMGTFRNIGADLSWIVGVEISSYILDFEGGTVIRWLQSFESPLATSYFSGVYIYGYVYLLIFPFLAYLLADDLQPFRTLTVAYAFNYVVGILLYVTFIAYGPRNYPIGVEQLLYDTWPQSQLLTSEVNVNTNVFPSLHSSVATTIAILAVRTRDRYPLWTLIAVPLAVSVCLSTMYLAIHWATDVVAGIALAVVAVTFAERYHDRFTAFIERARARTRDAYRDLRS
ncbi:Membrane-associated phospholipid phosphatase [Halapricum desulfuricans]|uniref:Membrane-associated phospholipid phosphatase n=1 Tax=Halapricum desulfuricans TaxID=2841257 RepID=A0A897NF81_9EURY|nr:phosphatase PAP2 family protein [Halapricum desulfuricans]QSG11198.1 Membrane-associated phospholipid phosphatase [Halapricum desulfuricans]